jgi:hypothetical protein
MSNCYEGGKIYAIRSNQTDKICIGSTIQPLSQRMSGHRASYKHFLNGKSHYVTSFELLKFDDAYIELIRKCPCESKEELLREEGLEIRKADCVNRQIAGRTLAEWREDNREQLLQDRREYYKNNKADVCLQQKLYREKNADKVQESHKNYYEKNKDKSSENKKLIIKKTVRN